MNINRKISARKRIDRLSAIREVADPIKDALLLEIMELYDSAMKQLDRVATLHSQVVEVNVGPDPRTNERMPALDDERFRVEVARTLEL